jgi:hypothetical protein
MNEDIKLVNLESIGIGFVIYKKNVSVLSLFKAQVPF